MFDKGIRELILTRPQMFISSRSSEWDNEALHVLIMLVIAQAVEPDSLNQCSTVKVSLESGGEIVIEDDGIGLPVAPLPEFPNSDAATLTLLLEGWMPTGEFTKDKYEVCGFLSYFATLLNFLSESLRIDTVRQGQAYMVSCSHGDIITPLQTTEDGTLSQGTRISFKPDPDIFPSSAFNEVSLKKGINELASKFPQVEFEFATTNNY